MTAVSSKYGSHTLVQFEDFGNQNAFRLLEKYQSKFSVFNDDIQGTGAVVLAGLFASETLVDKQVQDHTFLLCGAGEANLGVAKMIRLALCHRGLSESAATQRIFMMDSKGLLTKSGIDKMEDHKKEFAQDCREVKTVEEAIELIKPSVLIGATGKPGLFSEKIISRLSQMHNRPVIFALSNPTDHSECTAEQVYTWSDGRAVFASGSPYSSIDINNQTMIPGQANNCYIFPGMILAITFAAIQPVKEVLFYAAAEALAEYVKMKHQDTLTSGCLYPPLNHALLISRSIAVAVIKKSIELGLSKMALTDNLEELVAAAQYRPFS